MFGWITNLNKVHFTWDQNDYSRIIKNLPQNVFINTPQISLWMCKERQWQFWALHYGILPGGYHKRGITLNRCGERLQQTEMSCQPRYKNVTQGTTGAYQLPPGLLYPKGAAMEAVDRIDITRRRKEIPCVGLPISLANRIGYPHSQYFIVRVTG